MSRTAYLNVEFLTGKPREYSLPAATLAAAREAYGKHATNWLREPVSVAFGNGEDPEVVLSRHDFLTDPSPKGKGRKAPEIASPAAPIAPAKPKARKVLETLANGRTVRVPLTHASGAPYTAEQAKVWASIYAAQRKAGIAPVGAIMRATKAAA